MLNKELTIKEKIIFDEPMKNHTSFKIGGVADQFVIVNSIEELTEALKYAKEQNLKKYILGNGSNILVTDKGIRGLVIKVNIQNLEIQKLKNHIKITVGAGYKMMQLSSNLMKEEITGFEELSGIPGTIGGAIYMNAGAYNKEISDIILYTKCMDEEGNIFELSNDKQEFGYRNKIKIRIWRKAENSM